MNQNSAALIKIKMADAASLPRSQKTKRVEPTKLSPCWDALASRALWNQSHLHAASCPIGTKAQLSIINYFPLIFWHPDIKKPNDLWLTVTEANFNNICITRRRPRVFVYWEASVSIFASPNLRSGLSNTLHFHILFWKAPKTHFNKALQILKSSPTISPYGSISWNKRKCPQWYNYILLEYIT